MSLDSSESSRQPMPGRRWGNGSPRMKRQSSGTSVCLRHLVDARGTTLVRVVRRPHSLGVHARRSAGTIRRPWPVLEESLWPFALQQMFPPDAPAVQRV
jgi:hypothetical protein